VSAAQGGRTTHFTGSPGVSGCRSRRVNEWNGMPAAAAAGRSSQRTHHAMSANWFDVCVQECGAKKESMSQPVVQDRATAAFV
jgi:hypothetical protein